MRVVFKSIVISHKSDFSRFRVFFFFLVFIFIPNVYAIDSVKKSSSGICHDKDSRWYIQTKNFKAYASMKSCLSSGGRTYSGYRLSKSKESDTGYDRKLFPHWLDENHDCRNTRADSLINHSQVKVTFKTNEQCLVTGGKWYDPYTGKLYTKSSELDIDHIVPLKWAYTHGADKWTEYARASFANDADNIIAVDLSANRSKGAKGPTKWLPPNQSYRCDYIDSFQSLMEKYHLEMIAAEQRIFTKQKAACGQN